MLTLGATFQSLPTYLDLQAVSWRIGSESFRDCIHYLDPGRGREGKTETERWRQTGREIEKVRQGDTEKYERNRCTWRQMKRQRETERGR
jgi:hypothetical protein